MIERIFFLVGKLRKEQSGEKNKSPVRHHRAFPLSKNRKEQEYEYD